jgi:hypothetical protein
MATPARMTKQVRVFLTGLFLISAAIFIAVSLFIKQPPGDQPSRLPAELAHLIEIISLLTSLISLIALLSATIISWTREKREAEKTKLNQRLQEIRINREKIALTRETVELEKLLGQAKPD